MSVVVRISCEAHVADGTGWTDTHSLKAVYTTSSVVKAMADAFGVMTGEAEDLLQDLAEERHGVHLTHIGHIHIADNDTDEVYVMGGDDED